MPKEDYNTLQDYNGDGQFHVEEGILDDQDYKEVEALMAEKYGLSDKSLYRFREPQKEE